MLVLFVNSKNNFILRIMAKSNKTNEKSIKIRPWMMQKSLFFDVE